MQRVKNSIRFIFALTIALVLAATPYMQAQQLSSIDTSCKKTCCCGCGCGQEKQPVEEDQSFEGTCCCNVSAPAKKAEVPVDAQPRTIDQHEQFTVTAIPITFTEDVTTQRTDDSQVSVSKAHAPPLYILNSSYLI